MRFLVRVLLAAAPLVAFPTMSAAAEVYQATPAKAPDAATFVTRTTVWKCNDSGNCTARADGQRDQVMCQLVVRQVGILSNFTAGNAAFDADALKKCNAQAR